MAKCRNGGDFLRIVMQAMVQHQGVRALGRLHARTFALSASHQTDYSRCFDHPHHPRWQRRGTVAGKAGLDQAICLGPSKDARGGGSVLGLDRTQGPQETGEVWAPTTSKFAMKI